MLNDSSESDNGILGVIRGNPCNSSRSSDTYSNAGKWQVVALCMGTGLSCIDIALYKVSVPKPVTAYKPKQLLGNRGS